MLTHAKKKKILIYVATVKLTCNSSLGTGLSVLYVIRIILSHFMYSCNFVQCAVCVRQSSRH